MSQFTGNTVFLNSFIQSMYNVGQFGTSGKVTLGLYDGALPTDSQAINFTPASFTSQLVATFVNFSLSVAGSALILASAPANVTASRAATLTWCALVGQNGVGLILTPGLSGSTGNVILNTITPANGGSLQLLDAGVRVMFYQ